IFRTQSLIPQGVVMKKIVSFIFFLEEWSICELCVELDDLILLRNIFRGPRRLRLALLFAESLALGLRKFWKSSSVYH
ncbi:MAG: hypothetical protein MJ109_07490, partial [Kiritimatiellae bacterium]|nr:hypothetical protein [Kiritimatiellia bacterium]